MRSAVIAAAVSALMLTGCFGPKVWSLDDSLETQPYNPLESRALNLVKLFETDTENLKDSPRDLDIFRGSITNVRKDDSLRVSHFFGFLPVKAATTAQEAADAFVQQSVEALKLQFAADGFKIHRALVSLELDGAVRHSFFLERADVDCRVPADTKTLAEVNETATCRIDVLSPRRAPSKGAAPMENGFTAVPRWCEVAMYDGWRVTDVRIASKVWVTAEKTPTDLLNAARMQQASKRFPDGMYLYFLHEHTHEPLVMEKGQVRGFIETPIAYKKRIEDEERAKNAFGRKLNNAMKGFMSPRPGSLIE